MASHTREMVSRQVFSDGETYIVIDNGVLARAQGLEVPARVVMTLAERTAAWRS